jgi:naphthoate synthase
VGSVQWQPKLQRTFEDIGYEPAERMARITIIPPEVRNAFRPETIFELQEAFADALEAREARGRGLDDCFGFCGRFQKRAGARP